MLRGDPQAATNQVFRWLTMQHVDEVLSLMMKKGASDLHLGVGRPPFFRIDGDLMPTDFEILSDLEMEMLCKSFSRR